MMQELYQIWLLTAVFRVMEQDYFLPKKSVVLAVVKNITQMEELLIIIK